MELIEPLLALFHGLRQRLAHARDENGDDAGMSTLETAIIAIGLLVVAGLLVTAITAAVRSKIAKIQ